MALLLVLSSLLCLTNVLAVPTNVTDGVKPAAIRDKYRLPDYDVDHYKLQLTVPPEAFTDKSVEYTGTVDIDFSFVEETESIILHAHPDFITINRVNFNNLDYDEQDYSIEPDTSFLKIKTVNEVALNRPYTLTIVFTGRLNTGDMHGFYRSSYVDKDNVKKYLATTQFEPTHARKAFPCFDEPSFKAKFDVSITHPKDLKVLFNTKEALPPVVDSELITSTFETTPRQSTYLIAFIISEFTCSPGAAVNGVSFQVCSRAEAAETRALASDIGSKVIEKLNAFTGFDYSKTLLKMDQVAIPDFSAGAMENWGLVTYREAALLYDEAESSNRNKQRITTTIAHEFSHQWFGDLVTCYWWSVTFLNEGFATYFQYYIAKEVVTDDWELDKQFLLEQVHPVLEEDALINSQALQSPASTPTDIGNKFGSVSYNKGGSVLRMVEHFLGSDNFKKGLQKYIADNAYSNAVPADLWTALNTVAKDLPADTLGDVMENWITKSGYPLLTVKWNQNSVIISQQQFLLTGNDIGTKWYVPISYTTSTETDKFTSTSPKVWLTPAENVTVELPEGSDWIILNNQQTGYYRVNYDDYLWNSISAQLQSEHFGGIVDLNRANIIDDLFNLARANKVKYSLAFNIASFLYNDTSYYPWYAAFKGYDFLLKRVGQGKLRTAISNKVLDLMGPLYKSVPFSDPKPDEQIYTHTQVLALDWACRLGNDDCIQQVNKLFKDYKETKIRPDRNLRSVVYCNALRYSSNSTDWEFLWDSYISASDLATEQVTILAALGCTKNTELLKKYLTKTITDDSGIRSQDAAAAYASVYNGNPEGVAVAFEFLQAKWDDIVKKYQINSLGEIIKDIAERFTTQLEINILTIFIAREGLPEDFKTEATAALQSARVNLHWNHQFEKELNEYYGISNNKNGVGKIGASFAFVTLLAVFVSKFFGY